MSALSDQSPDEYKLELVPTWLQSEATEIDILPPVETLAQELPLSNLSWENFERLCYRLARESGKVRLCRLYGHTGQEQHGIDLFLQELTEEKLVVFQCKRVRNFGVSQIRAAVSEFLAGKLVPRVSKFVLCTTESLRDTKRWEAVEEQEGELKKHNIGFQIWDELELSALLKRRPSIVADFFGVVWAHRFCGLGSDPIDAIGFVSYCGPKSVPSSLRPHDGFVGRTQEFETLLTQLVPNSMISIYGSGASGKSAFIAEALSRQITLESLLKKVRSTSDVAILLLDLKPAWGRHSVLRRLLYALGENKRVKLGGDEGEDDSVTEEIRAELFFEILPTRFGGQSPLVIIDRLDCLPARQDCLSDLIELLKMESLRHGVAILMSRSEVVWTEFRSTLRDYNTPIILGQLCPDEATDLLSRLIKDTELARETVNVLAPDAEHLMLPLFLRQGARNFLREAAQAGAPRTALRLSDSILEAAAFEVTETLARANCTWEEDPNRLSSGQITLYVMAIIANQSISAAEIQTAQLDVDYFNRLASLGWFYKKGEGFLIPDLARTVFRRQMTSMASTGEEQQSTLLANGVKGLLTAITDIAREDNFSSLQQHLEEAVAWLDRASFSKSHPVRISLETFLLPLARDDAIFPFSDAEVSVLSQNLESQEGLSAAIARLAAASCGDISPPMFLAVWSNAVDNAAKSKFLTSYHLRVLDSAGNHGVTDRHLFREILKGRRKLLVHLDRISGQRTANDETLARAVASWLLNTAELAFRLEGDSDEVGRLRTRALELLDDAPGSTHVRANYDMAVLRSRLSRLAADAARSLDERSIEFEKSAKYAEKALLADSSCAPRVVFYFRAVGRLLEALPQKTDREAWLNRVEMILGKVFQSLFSDWPPIAQGHFLSLLREESEFYLDPADRLSKLKAVATKLSPITGKAFALAKHGDARSLLVFGRTFRQLSRAYFELARNKEAESALFKAEEIALFAIKHDPTPTAWRFRLSLLEIVAFPQIYAAWDLDADAVPISAEDQIRQTVFACRRWIRTNQMRSISIGALELMCHQCLWRIEGSIIRVAKLEAEREGRDFFDFSARSRCRKLEEIAAVRRSALSAIERFHGGFVTLALSKIRNEAQLEFSLALMRKNGEFDAQRILGLFEKAAILFPDSNLLLRETARFFRRIWHYGEAIESYELAFKRTRETQIRSEIAGDLVEALLTAAHHCNEVKMPDGRAIARNALLDRAKVVLVGTFGNYSGLQRTAILRDLLAVERGEFSDWERLEETYRLVVGSEEGYLHTMSGNLSILRDTNTVELDHIADTARNDFTHTNPLRAMGMLFLRRAELGDSRDAIVDMARAYGCFNACRVWERSALGKETPTTGFELARTIISAVKVSRSVLPFKLHPEDEGYANLLTLAKAKLQSAKDRSVGAFHVAIRELIREAEILGHELAVQV